MKAPIGTGPYKLVDYELNSRIVLERNDAYWGPKPKMKNVTFQIIKDPSARVAAIQSGQVDLTLNVPVREADRFKKDANFKAELDPIERVIIIQTRGDLALPTKTCGLPHIMRSTRKPCRRRSTAAPRCRCRSSRRRTRPAMSKATRSRTTSNWRRSFWPIPGFSASKPAKIKLATTNGQFPGDYDMARAIAQMWKKVGIDAEIEVIEYSKYFELNRGNKLPEATLYSWDNATGDPEMFTGYLLNPQPPVLGVEGKSDR